MPSYILALDQGTTGSRAVLIDKQGFIKGKSYTEFPQYFPQPGWVEHHPGEILKATFSVIRGALREARIQPDKIAAIGITNQRETVVCWDRSTGRPLHRAIVWQDRRTSEICSALKRRGLADFVRNKTGLVLDPYFSATKIQWLLKHVPGLRRKAAQGRVCFGTVDAWILWNLTQGKSYATDFSNASRTMLFNIRTRKWDPELLKIFGVPETVLPEVRPSAYLFGKTAGSGGLPPGIPIAGIAGDQQAALFGQGCYEPGSSKNTYGTGCFLVLNSGHKMVTSKSGLLTTIACDRKGGPVFALEGSIFIGGAVIQWVRDGLGFIKTAVESEKIAKAVRDTRGVTLVPAFVGLGAPYWDAEARGAILGLTRGTRREHIVRAALESIAYQVADVLEAMRKDSHLSVRELKVDGGATENYTLMQFQADMLGIPIRRSSRLESTVWGAAKLAGLASGFWPDPGRIDRAVHYRTFHPRFSSAERKRRHAAWRESVRRILTVQK